MNKYIIRHVFALLVVALAPLFFWIHDVSAALPCSSPTDYFDSTALTYKACPVDQVCIGADSCAPFALNFGPTSVTSASTNVNVQTNARINPSFNLFSCLGPSTTCLPPPVSPYWTNYGFSTNFTAVISGLRSGRTYTETYRGDWSTTSSTKEVQLTTWPGYQTPATESSVTSSSAIINWNTVFPGDTEVWAGNNPPRWSLETIIPQTTEHLVAVSAISDGTSWAVGGNGKITKRTSPTSGWVVQNSNTTRFLSNVDAFDASRVWAAGFVGTVVRTTDGGSSWTVSTIPGNPDLRGLTSALRDTAWVAGDNGTVYYFNGSSWVQRNIPISTHLRTITTVDDKTVWVGGLNGTIMKSTDGGVTWNQLVTNIIDEINSLATLDGTTVWAGGANGTLLKSTNGTTWSGINIGLGISGVDNIQIVNPSELWFTSDNQVGQTTDGGTSFTYFSQPGLLISASVEGLAVSTGADILTVGQQMKIPNYSLFTNSTPYYGDDTLGTSLTTHKKTLAGLGPPGTRFYYAALSSGSGVASGVFGEFDLFLPDTTPPTISITSPTNPTFTKNTPITVSGTANDMNGGNPGALNSITISVNGGAPITATAPGVPGASSASWTVPNVTLQPGLNTIQATATDMATPTGNIGTSFSITVTLDTQVPVVNITNPLYDSTVSSDPTSVDVNATDNDQITTMGISVNGGARQNSVLGSPSNNVNWASQALNLIPGLMTNTVTVYATDRAGNEGSKAITFGYIEPTFTLAATPPAPQTKNAGDSVIYNLTLTSVNGFANPNVALSATGTPAGSVITFSPAFVGLTAGGTATATLTVATNTTTTGTFNIVITGTGGGKSDSQTVVLTLLAAPDFTLLAPGGASRNIVAGQPTAYQLAVNANTTFNATVAIQPLSGQPLEVSGTFTSSSITLAPSQTLPFNLNITTLSTVVPGTYTLTVTGTSGALIHTLPLTLTISAAPDLALNVVPPLQNVIAGGPSTQYIATAISTNGFTEDTTLSVTKTPNDPNITVTLTPFTFISQGMWVGNSNQSFTLNVSTTSAVPPDDYILTLTAVSATKNKTFPVTLRVGADTTPPFISNIDVTKGADNATFTWTTDELANSQVIIYSDAAQTSVVGTVNAVAFSLNHSLFYTPLVPLTTYYFSVTSVDQAPTPAASGICPTAGNCASVFAIAGIPLQFTTLDVPDTIIPDIWLDQPAVNATITGTVSIAGRASDNKNVQDVFLTVTDKLNPDPLTNKVINLAKITPQGQPCPSPVECTFSYSWNTATITVPNGPYRITVYAVDFSNNKSAEVWIDVTTLNDLDPPQLCGGPAPIPGSLQCSGGKCQITIRWCTTGATPSSSSIRYGLTASKDLTHSCDDADPANPTPTDPSKCLGTRYDHNVTLTNLDENTTYHYEITSCNISKVCTN